MKKQKSSLKRVSELFDDIQFIGKFWDELLNREIFDTLL